MMEQMDTPGAASTAEAAMQSARGEARGWLRRLHGGEATSDDVAALEHWRAQSPAHARAFAEESLFWSVLGDAARQAERDRAAQPVRARLPASRRDFLIGGTALAASAAAIAVISPPLGLWPSAAEWSADYRTATGERRQLDLLPELSLELNTRTSLDIRQRGETGAVLELVSGEAAIVNRGGSTANVTVVAGAGRINGRGAAFNIRKTGTDVRVTCTSGRVDVDCHQRTRSLAAGQQFAYGASDSGDVVAADAEIVTAWQRGMLMFRRAPLSEVIEEVNRYRSGRVVLVDSALAQRQIMANFRLDRIDDVIDFIAKGMNLRVRTLPGGVVLVG